MMKRHKWADVLIALAEGKKVQYKFCDSSEWIDLDVYGNIFSVNPLTTLTTNWRIKPDPKPDIVGFGNILKDYYSPDMGFITPTNVVGFSNFETLEAAQSVYFYGNRSGVIQCQYKMVWDGETGEPKSIGFVR